MKKASAALCFLSRSCFAASLANPLCAHNYVSKSIESLVNRLPTLSRTEKRGFIIMNEVAVAFPSDFFAALKVFYSGRDAAALRTRTRTKTNPYDTKANAAD
jgi:hypothetical protein